MIHGIYVHDDGWLSLRALHIVTVLCSTKSLTSFSMNECC